MGHHFSNVTNDLSNCLAYLLRCFESVHNNFLIDMFDEELISCDR